MAKSQPTTPEPYVPRVVVQNDTKLPRRFVADAEPDKAVRRAMLAAVYFGKDQS